MTLIQTQTLTKNDKKFMDNLSYYTAQNKDRETNLSCKYLKSSLFN